jgi:hypothetical protein
MSEKDSEPDIEARRFNVAEVPFTDKRPLPFSLVQLGLIPNSRKDGVLNAASNANPL